VEVCTLDNGDGDWRVLGNPIETKGVSYPLNGATYVLEGRTGDRRDLNRHLFFAAVKGEHAQLPNPSPSIFVTVGAKGARAYCNVDGERLGKVDWSLRNGTAIAAQVVERMSSKALVVITEKQIGLAYSLPSLDRIAKFQFLSLDLRCLTIDQSGDFVAFNSTGTHQGGAVDKLIYGTVFDVRRLRGPPEVNFNIKPCPVAQPQPVSIGPGSRIGSWISYSKTWSGKQIDDLLGGPDRPLLVRPPDVQQPKGNNVADSAATFAAASATAGANMWSGLTNAMNERGQLLGELGDRFNALEAGSRNMAKQAKKAAAQQSAKSWFGF